ATRLPWEDGFSPSAMTRMPALARSSLNLPISSIIARDSGVTSKSFSASAVDFTITITRIVILLVWGEPCMDPILTRRTEFRGFDIGLRIFLATSPPGRTSDQACAAVQDFSALPRRGHNIAFLILVLCR